MDKEVNIAQVSVKHSDTNFDVISLHQFLKISAEKRHDLVKGQKIEFIDINGNKIKLLDGLRAITQLMRKLREEGNFAAYMETGTV